MKINAASACWSSLPYAVAVGNIDNGTVEPMIGTLCNEHLQLCPQHPDPVSEKLIDSLQENFPHIQFRLHSDVRLINKRGVTIDVIDFNEDTKWYFETLSKFSTRMGAPVYSLHAGYRKENTLKELFEKAHRIQELFDCPVAVEGHYPAGNNKYLLSSWNEYEALYKEGLFYALDLSHLNIVAKKEGWNYDLTKEMLSSPQCKEIHISFNEGHLDNHMIATDNNMPIWNVWKQMIEQSGSTADIFSEGNQVLHLRNLAKQEENIEKV